MIPNESLPYSLILYINFIILWFSSTILTNPSVSVPAKVTASWAAHGPTNGGAVPFLDIDPMAIPKGEFANPFWY